MLAFIALANVSWHLWGRPTTGMTAHVPTQSVLDTIGQVVLTVAVDGRAYPLFAFLFGYGMVQFHRSRIARGIQERTVRRMLRRRHWSMLLFGALHAALLFMGDVLGAYGLAGLLLVWLFFRRRDRVLVVFSAILGGLLLLTAVFALVGGIAVLATSSPDDLASSDPAGFLAASRDATAGQSDYLRSVLARLAYWGPLTLGQVAGGAIPLCIVLGWLAARHRLLEDTLAHRRRLWTFAIGGIAIGWVGGAVVALDHFGVLPGDGAVPWAFSNLGTVTGIACGVGYASVFALVAGHFSEEARRPLPVRAVAAVGERSLTFYLFQSLLFAPLLAAWGLGLGDVLSTAGALAVALGVWLLSLPLARALARHGRRGPAEAALRARTNNQDTGAHGPGTRTQNPAAPAST
jgi:uncharacterized membrane protein YeiB